MAHREVKVPPEVERAADAVLDMRLTHKKAREMFWYCLLTRAIGRENGNKAAAAKKLGMTRQQMSELPEMLEARLA